MEMRDNFESAVLLVAHSYVFVFLDNVGAGNSGSFLAFHGLFDEGL